jgi:FMN-dependent NADH-azoreductase
MKILHVAGSPRGERSLSKKLGQYAAGLAGTDIETLDVHAEKIPFHTASSIGLNYGFGDYGSLDADSKAAVDAQKKYVEQLRSADVLIISAPMWNFGMPAALKAWFDLILKVNDTFSMDQNGYRGHVKNLKKAVVITTAGGGSYETAPMDAYDYFTGHLLTSLGFIGITDVKLVRVEGVNANPDSLPEKTAAAEKAISEYLSA